MAQPLSIESNEHVYFITTRTADSRLLIVRNKLLEEQILGCLARYQAIYGVVIYGFILMGNHYHLIAKFPNCNRAAFMRDFNSATARLIGRAVGIHGRRSVWGRRYSWQILPRDEDIRHWYYYLVLNPVSSGLVEEPKQYNSYSSFLKDKETYTWVDYSKYLLKKRYDPEVSMKDFEITYTLTYSKLPGSEEEEMLAYRSKLIEELEVRRLEAVAKRKTNGFGFMGLRKLMEQKVGARPRRTKTSTRDTFRPLVLTLCKKTKKLILSWYFYIKDKFQEASELFRSGQHSAIFPTGTYRPPCYVEV